MPSKRRGSIYRTPTPLRSVLSANTETYYHVQPFALLAVYYDLPPSRRTHNFIMTIHTYIYISVFCTCTFFLQLLFFLYKLRTRDPLDMIMCTKAFTIDAIIQSLKWKKKRQQFRLMAIMAATPVRNLFESIYRIYILKGVKSDVSVPGRGKVRRVIRKIRRNRFFILFEKSGRVKGIRKKIEVSFQVNPVSVKILSLIE